MGTSSLQKQRERIQLDRFLETLGLQARIIEERESPDFIVCLEGKEVGIELTELFISHKTNAYLTQAQESFADKIVSHAQRLYQKSAAPPAHVTICFYPSANLTTINRRNLSEKLSSFVRYLNLGLWQSVNLRPEEFEESPLPEEIANIHALGVPNYGMAHWTIAHAGWAAPLTTQALQARINEKSKKLTRYQKVIPENWLIITSNYRPSQLFSISPGFDSSGIISPFSKTFYCAYPYRTLINLGT